ncbi:hypothetical protein ACIQTW_11495 [Paenarthrobacter sp. NPDC090517]|uniref:hypothetical protein n=1 Tax=Paenarthrobacter sp. NPDC090517 TaxID=3364381 RepID=UPI0037FFFEDF
MLPGAAVSTAVGTTISAAIMGARDASRATVCRAFGTTIGTTISAAIMGARDASRATVCRAFGTTVSTAVGTAVSAAIMGARDAGRATVCRAFLLAWILLWNGHASSRESNGVLRLRISTPDSKPDDRHRHRP